MYKTRFLRSPKGPKGSPSRFDSKASVSASVASPVWLSPGDDARTKPVENGEAPKKDKKREGWLVYHYEVRWWGNSIRSSMAGSPLKSDYLSWEYKYPKRSRSLPPNHLIVIVAKVASLTQNPRFPQKMGLAHRCAKNDKSCESPWVPQALITRYAKFHTLDI